MAIYERNETFTHWTTIRDRTGQRQDPTSVEISIIEPNGSTILSSQAMTKDSTGEYYYDYDLSSTATYGRYTVEVDAVSGGTHHSIHHGFFYVMPWKLEQSVQSKTGIDSNDISDDDLSHLCWSSYKEALRDVYSHHYKETPSGDPDTGEGFDGTNTSFQTHYYPIADIDGDGVVGDDSDDSSDIECWWIDDAGSRQDGYVTITNSDNGEINITQDDTVSAIPSNIKGVFLDYWSEFYSYDDFIFQEAVSYLAAHYVTLRFTERGYVTIGDLNTNKPVILQQPNRFLREYKRKIKTLCKPKFTGVK